MLLLFGFIIAANHWQAQLPILTPSAVAFFYFVTTVPIATSLARAMQSGKAVLRIPRTSEVLLATVAAALGFAAVWILAREIGVPLHDAALFQGVLLPLTFVLEIVLSPVSEELVFQGAVQTSLNRKVGVVLSLLLTTLLFNVLHFTSPQNNALLCIPLLTYGILRVYSRALMMPFMAHASYNAIIVAGSVAHWPGFR